MPKAVHDLSKKLQAKGMSERMAWAIAYTQIAKRKKKEKK